MKELFYKPIKVNHTASDILIWGCMHMYHDPSWDVPLWKLRGYDSVDEHAKSLIENWNLKASDTTIGFLLGDTMFGKGGKFGFEEILDQMSFDTLYICAGNHYAGWHQSFNSVEENVLKLGDKTVIFGPNYFEAFINGQSVVLSHYPILSWNGIGRGSYMLYSHVHGQLSKSVIGSLFKESELKQYEVSIEENEFPPSFEEIHKIMLDKKGDSVDGHGRDTKNPF